jgi:hypothetical protein
LDSDPPANDRGAATVPAILPGFSDSLWFREAFHDRVAYVSSRSATGRCRTRLRWRTALEERIDLRT